MSEVTVIAGRRNGKLTQARRAVADAIARGTHAHVLAPGGKWCSEPCPGFSDLAARIAPREA